LSRDLGEGVAALPTATAAGEDGAPAPPAAGSAPKARLDFYYRAIRQLQWSEHSGRITHETLLSQHPHLVAAHGLR